MTQSGDMFPKITLPEPEPKPEPQPEPDAVHVAQPRTPDLEDCRCDIEVFEETDGHIPVIKPRRIRINGVETLTPKGAPIQVTGLIDGQPLTVSLTVFATSLTVHRVEPEDIVDPDESEDAEDNPTVVEIHCEGSRRPQLYLALNLGQREENGNYRLHWSREVVKDVRDSLTEILDRLDQ